MQREELYQTGEQVYGKRYNAKGEEIAFVPFREEPKFPGGEPGLLKYLNQHIRYPAASAKQKISGLVVLRFMVDKTGVISQVHVVKSVNEELDAEAMRVVKRMPAWEPGKLEGERTDVLMHLPVRFSYR